MTTTIPIPSQQRVLRRTRQGRVAAGVSAGFGRYFGVDPVLFRVLFATASFFGGAGILAYLLAWAAIPDEGAERAAVDGWVAALRRRRVPVWVVAFAGGLLLWAAAASWWAPGPPLAVMALAGVAIAAVLGRRRVRGPAAPAPVVPEAVVSEPLPSATLAAETLAPETAAPVPAERPDSEVRAWLREARIARRERAHRAQPMRIAALVTLVVVLTVLALVNAARGIELQVYFWTTLGIALLGLLGGVVARRTPWSLLTLLVLGGIGAAAFGGSDTQLHDGLGQRTWTPTTTGSVHYRLAFGEAVLDLHSVTGAARIDVTVGAGDVRIVAAPDLALTVDARVHIGRVELDGTPDDASSGTGDGGVGVHRVVRPPAGSSGAPVTVYVHLADGRVHVSHQQ